jgi:hypothetical protein
MRKRLSAWSLLSALAAGNVVLALSYLGLVAFSMSYAALEVEFSQSVKDDQAAVAALDARYLAALRAITASDYSTLGYAPPAAEFYVPAAPATAINLR